MRTPRGPTIDLTPDLCGPQPQPDDSCRTCRGPIRFPERRVATAIEIRCDGALSGRSFVLDATDNLAGEFSVYQVNQVKLVGVYTANAQQAKQRVGSLVTNQYEACLFIIVLSFCLRIFL